MLDLSQVRKTDTVTHLFFPATAMNEIIWLLKKAGAQNGKDFKVKQWRKVVANQVPEIKKISESERNAEIQSLYGDDARVVMMAPVVLLSKYNKEDLIRAFSDTIHGDGDADYREYFNKKQEQARQNIFEDDDDNGIRVLNRD